MNFKINLLKNNNKRNYLIEITDEVTVWCIEKRFQEIFILKEDLAKKFSYKFTSFPKKQITNSYSDETFKNRLDGFSIFFGISKLLL